MGHGNSQELSPEHGRNVKELNSSRERRRRTKPQPQAAGLNEVDILFFNYGKVSRIHAHLDDLRQLVAG